MCVRTYWDLLSLSIILYCLMTIRRMIILYRDNAVIMWLEINGFLNEVAFTSKLYGDGWSKCSFLYATVLGEYLLITWCNAFETLKLITFKTFWNAGNVNHCDIKGAAASHILATLYINSHSKQSVQINGTKHNAYTCHVSMIWQCRSDVSEFVVCTSVL